ncbi:HupE/UreJ family protein [Rhizobacter sp. Root1221]|uniref:HupE/UreJ family protein n=1 Tax=Rhizobacter sp. Root1221 TaxID=1736433 RepID=UPI0009E9A739|nr:HupE/UreJ family protein [Rhizobacter sp. Root1221]
MITNRPPARAALATALLALATSPAFAHHAMDGETPRTFLQGLLSGIAHPVIGLDHLAFVLAAAWLVSRLAAPLRVGLAAAFVAGSLAGTVLHLASVDVPVSELLVALTVVAAGLAVAWHRLAPTTLLWLALPVAGVLHGYAYGESIVGAERMPLGAYLLGFALIQSAVMLGVAALLSRRPLPQLQRAAVPVGAVVGLVGAYFAFVQLNALAA